MSAPALTQRPISTGVPKGRLRIGIAASLSFLALAALILSPLFGPFAVLVFLTAGGLLIVIRPNRSIQAVLRYWPLLILPLFCLLSFLWSQFPALTLRYGIQFAITVVIAIVIANRISPTTFVRCLFAIYSIGILGSVVFGSVRDDIGAWIGIFGSKNAFAAVVSGFTLTAIAILFDRTAPRLVRLAAFAGVAAAGPLLLKAQSTGAILFMIPASTMALAILFSKHFNWLQKTAICMLLITIAAATLILAMQYSEILFQNLLNYSGKDVTLTGRTELWEFGTQIIREHPLLGLGYRAFWVPDYPPAELLWAMFDIQARSGFNFHNTYVNNAVEIGFIGVMLQIIVLYGALLRTYLWAFRSPSPETAYLASFLTLVVCSSFMEVAVFFQFSVTSIIVICAFIYATHAKAERKQGRVSVARSKDQPALT